MPALAYTAEGVERETFHKALLIVRLGNLYGEYIECIRLGDLPCGDFGMKELGSCPTILSATS